MSLDLYQDQLIENVGNLTPTVDVEPGVFDGFFRGAGMTTMRGFAQAARTAGMLTAAIPTVGDKINAFKRGTTSQGVTELSDSYFRAIDDTLGSAVDYWTPKPNEVGVAGQVVGTLFSVLPMAIASPPLAALSAADIGPELVQKGVPASQASGVAAVMTGGLMTGIWMPILGNNLWQRTLLGGAGFNVVQGVATRAGAEAILHDRPEAKQFEPFSLQDLTIDVLLGLAFGAYTHINPQARAQGEAAWKVMSDWAQSLTPTQVASLATLRTAQHLNTDSTPGIPVDTQDIDTHVQRMRQAIDQLVRGEPVNIEDVKPAPRETIPPDGEPPTGEAETIAREAETLRAAGQPAFVVDPEKRITQARDAAELLAAAEAVRLEEGLPRVADGPLIVPADIAALAPDLQARHIGEMVTKRLLELDMLPEQAQANGAIWAAFFKTAGEKYGVSPADLLAKYGIDVQRASAGAEIERTLYQEKAPTQAEGAPARRGLEDEEVRKHLQTMADEEAGWAQIGGRLDVGRLVAEHGPDILDEFGRPTKLGTVAFTEWIPKSEWWTSRPGHPGRGLNEAKTKAAVKKALAGEKMNALERRTVDHMLDVLNERLAGVEEVGHDRWNEVAKAGVEEGLEPTTANVVDTNTIVRAMELAHGEMSAIDDRLTMKYGESPTPEEVARWDREYMAEARRIIDEHEAKNDTEADQAKADGEGGPQGPRTLYQADEPRTWYYSELARQLDAAQIKSAPAKGWKDYLKSLPQKGVKAEEIRWSGIEEWLDLQPGKVTKQQVTEFLKQGGVQVKDVLLGKPNESTPQDAVIARDTALLEQNGFIIDRDPGNDDPAHVGDARWGIMERETSEIFAFPGDADSWRASRNPEATGRERTPGEMGEAPPIPDNVVDAIDRVLAYLNRGEMPARPDRSPTDGDIAQQVVDLNMHGHRVERPQGEPRWGIVDERTGTVYRTSQDVMDLMPRDLDDAIGSSAVRVLEYLNEQPAPAGWEGVVPGPEQAVARPTKFSSYQLPGGRNYRELLLTLPDPDINVRVREFAKREGIDNIQEAYRRYAEYEERGYQRARPGEFRSSHFPDPNILAHVRFNERTDAEGKRVLFVEEFQSDWAQQGRKEGFRPEEAIDPEEIAGVKREFELFKSASDASWNQAREIIKTMIPGSVQTRANAADSVLARIYTDFTNGNRNWAVDRGLEDPDQIRIIETAMEDITRVERLDRQLQRLESAARDVKGIPRAPFVEKTEAWTQLVLKRTIRYAAEHGFDKIAWTRGEQQVERYTGALRKAVDVIEWEKTADGIHLVGFKGRATAEQRAKASQIRDEIFEVDKKLNDLLDSVDTGSAQELPRLQRVEYDMLIAQRRTLVGQLAEIKNNGIKVVDTTEKETALSDAIGKAMAEQIISDPNAKGTIEGQDIKVSDTGMAGFYDRLLPIVAKDVIKKLGGGKVGETNFENITAPAASPAMREMSRSEWGVFSGAEPFGGGPGMRPVIGDGAIRVDSGESSEVTIVADAHGVELVGEDADSGLRVSWDDLGKNPKNSAEASVAIATLWEPGSRLWTELGSENGFDYAPGVRASVSKQPSFDITPAMREKAMKGLPLFQRQAATADTTPKGAITLGDGQTIIRLFESADASTFAHESGHLFLEMTKDLAGRDGVPPEALQDWATLANWLGIEGGPITTAAHEKFARGWEQYLAEGVAPNEALRSVFQRFRDWLLDVYNRLLGRGLEVELTDPVRGVMARMLESQAKDPSPVREVTKPEISPQDSPVSATESAAMAPGAEGTPVGPPPAEGGTKPPGPADTAETAPDHVANEANRIALERPNLRIRTGTDAEGGAIYTTAADFIAGAKAQAAQARDDIRLIEAAAECLLGTA